jgi:hypothetical protein
MMYDLAVKLYAAKCKYNQAGGYCYPATFNDLSPWAQGELIALAEAAHEYFTSQRSSHTPDSDIPAGAD